MRLKKSLKILNDGHMRVTSQRLHIVKYLEENRTHPTADDIYLALKKENPSLSKTTVYNSLNILSKHNVVQVLTISPAELRYDSMITPHHHFLCKKCGKIIDLNIKCPYLEKALKDEHKIEEVHGYFKGTCKDCLRKQKKR